MSRRRFDPLAVVHMLLWSVFEPILAMAAAGDPDDRDDASRP
jgi:hypothetical protein